MEETHSHFSLANHRTPELPASEIKEEIDAELSKETKTEVEEGIKIEVKEEIETVDFDNYDLLNVVLEEDHMEKYNSQTTLFCDQCGFLAGHPSKLKSHIKSVHGERTHKCEHCDYSATTSSILNTHFRNKHSCIKYQCEDCEYMAGTKGNLKVHRLSKHMNIKFNCTFCDFETSHQANLKKHIKGKHTNDEEKERNLKRCSLCDFTTLWSLNKHMRYVHKHDHKHKSDMMKCQWQGCEYETHKNSYFEEHVSLHEGYMHKCGDCDFEAEKIKDLKLHQYLKHEQNKHFCDQCSATFKFRSRLEKHIETAHLDINYPWDQCDHIATCDHMKRAHGSKYQCELCEYVSNRPNLLRAHIKSKHGSNSKQQQLQKPTKPTTEDSAKDFQKTETQQFSQQSEHTEAPLNLMHSIFNPTPDASISYDHKKTTFQPISCDPIALPQQTSQTSDAKELEQSKPQQFSYQSEQEVAPVNLTNTKQLQQTEPQESSLKSEQEETPLNLTNTIFNSAPFSSDHIPIPVQPKKCDNIAIDPSEWEWEEA